MDFTSVHFIGIGGVSMSGLALILKNRGSFVTGSDRQNSEFTDMLVKADVKVHIGHSDKNISEGVSLVVYNSAIKDDNPEMIEAKARGIELMGRGELLGFIMRSFEQSAAIAGMHGKTTTSCMLSEIFVNAKKDPTLSLGGVLPSIKSNLRIGNSPYFVAEACEYYDNFLNFYPKVGVILNIEEDHLDYFADINAIYKSFSRYAENAETVLINSSIRDWEKVTEGCVDVVTFGFDNADYMALDIRMEQDGNNSFDFYEKGTLLGRIKLGVKGHHNTFNALAACSAARLLGLEFESIRDGIVTFSGTVRRFEVLGQCNGFTVIDDYAHHPTEIKACLETAKSLSHNKLLCVFQPHTFTRTLSLLKEFSESFYLADEVIIVDIYPAREPDLGLVHSKDLVKLLINNGVNAKYFSGFYETENYIRENCFHNDLCITMGAGDVRLVGERLITK